MYSMILARSPISWLIMVSEKEINQSGWYLSIDLFYDIYNFYGLSPFTFALDIEVNCMYLSHWLLPLELHVKVSWILLIIAIIRCHANCLNDTGS